MSEPLVLHALTKRYGAGPAVLDGLSHRFAPGSATALVGPNGAGKTTLLRLLAVAAFPTTGSVRYGDLDVHAHPHAYLKHAGILLDGGGLPEYLSAVELLEWVLRARGRWDAAGGPRRIDAVLEALRLDDRRHNLIGTYSSGMLKKTELAAALVAEPDVVLLDEPLRGLDADSRDAARTLLRAVRDRGGLVVIASHLRLDGLVDETITFGER